MLLTNPSRARVSLVAEEGVVGVSPGYRVIVLRNPLGGIFSHREWRKCLLWKQRGGFCGLSAEGELAVERMRVDFHYVGQPEDRQVRSLSRKVLVHALDNAGLKHD